MVTRRQLLTVVVTGVVLTSAGIGMLSVVPTTVKASDGVPDVTWSTSDKITVYDIDDRSVSQPDPVTLTKSGGDYNTVVMGDHQGGHPWAPWLDAYDTRLIFRSQVESTALENGDADSIGVKYGIVDSNMDPGYLNSVESADWLGPETGDQLVNAMSNLNPRVYMSGYYIYYGLRLENAEFGGIFGDDDKTTISNIRIIQSYEGQNLEKRYTFGVSSAQIQSTTGEATLTFNHEAVSHGDPETNPLFISINGRVVYQDTPISGKVLSTSFDPSILTEGENTVRVYVEQASGTDANHDDYGYVIKDVSVTVPTDGDYDDDTVNNWNDPAKRDADADGDGLKDGEDPCMSNPNCDGTGKDDSADRKPQNSDNDGDGLPDSPDPQPNDPNADDSGKEDGADQMPTNPDNDADGLPDSTDPQPNDPNADDSGKDDSADRKPTNPDNDGDGIHDGNDSVPNTPEDVDQCRDDDGAPDPDGTCVSDADGDGVNDSTDAAPGQPEDQDGYQDGDGVPDSDNDGDGILDDHDAAPADAEDMDGYRDADGSPVSGNGGGDVPAVVGETPPVNPDSDRALEDINGDQQLSKADVHALFDNRASSAVRANPSAFDYNGDGEFNIVDIQKLNAEVTD